jgi:hypothetical protein
MGFMGALMATRVALPLGNFTVGAEEQAHKAKTAA